MAGRRPKSRAQREASGGGGHRPMPNDPKPDTGWPEMPLGLSVVARKQWRRLGEILEAEKRLTKSDGPSLEGAARLYDSWMVCERRARLFDRLAARYLSATRSGVAVPVETVLDEFELRPPDATSTRAERDAMAIASDLVAKASAARQEARMFSDAYRKWLNDSTITPGTRARAQMPEASGTAQSSVLGRLQAQAAGLRLVR